MQGHVGGSYSSNSTCMQAKALAQGYPVLAKLHTCLAVQLRHCHGFAKQLHLCSGHTEEGGSSFWRPRPSSPGQPLPDVLMYEACWAYRRCGHRSSRPSTPQQHRPTTNPLLHARPSRPAALPRHGVRRRRALLVEALQDRTPPRCAPSGNVSSLVALLKDD